MKTDDVIDLLARGAGPAPQHVAFKRLAPALVVGFVVSAVLTWWGFGLVPAATHAQPAWWLKVGYAVGLSAAACWWAVRAGRPGASTRLPTLALLGLVLAMAALAVMDLMQGTSDERWAAWLGHSWQVCPRNVFMLSLPALALALWAVRGLAPTRPRNAGMAAGALAGGLAAAAYTLACTEVAMPFVVTWYTLGVAFSALVGAWLGPRVLRW
jgi:hypothetical protein